MEPSTSSWLTDAPEEGPRGWLARRAKPQDTPSSGLWSQLSAFGERLRRGHQAERSSGEVTTQLEHNVGRGHALREAHRTLARHIQLHPALRQVTPHLGLLERALRKKGSRALQQLPLPLLRRALEQLALLQSDDESTEDANHLRVLRLRLMEALALRSARERQGLPAANDTPSQDRQDLHRAEAALRGAGVDVRQASVEEFRRAQLEQAAPRLRSGE